MSEKELLIGGHVSAAGGLKNAINNAEAIGANAIQIFGSSPQTWVVRMPSDTDVTEYKKRLHASNVKQVYLHAAYLVNLASASDLIYRRSVQSLTDHLKVAEKIGAEGLIFHVGSSKGIARDEALRQEIEGMKKVIESVPGRAHLIMENTAGGGEKIWSIEDIGFLFKKIGSRRVKVCFDTAHAFEAGIVKEYTKETVSKLCDEMDVAFGIENLAAIHANDSKTICESHHDQHQNIGEGYIGIAGFRALAREKRLRDKAWLLEVPGFSDEGPDKKNIDILRRCFG